MLDLFLFNKQPQTINHIIQRSRLQWSAWYLGIIGTAGLVALLMARSNPNFSWLAWLFMGISISAILYQPRYGVYLALFWTLLGDHSLMPWYPFIKNFSSRETLLFLHDAVVFSPLELTLLVTLGSWLLRETLQRKLRPYLGPLFWPAVLFLAFITFGLIYGIVRGGDFNIALWETRAIFHMALIMVLVGNLFKNKSHIKSAIWIAAAALVIKALYGTYYFLIVLRGNLNNIDSLTDHQAAIHLSMIVVLAGAALLYRVAWGKRLLLIAVLPPILLTMLAAQRRSGFVALLIGYLLLTFILFIERRKLFWLIVPPAAVIGFAYIGVFWNSASPVAGPAQAIKSVINEDQATAHDRSSNDYRKIENYNSRFTIRQEPLTGVGFGNKFYNVIPLPDISNFIWWEYIPHNSIVYIWIKSGIGGFISLLLFISISIMQGMRATVRITDPHLKAIALTATIYIIMHFIYAYVDISWEAQSMVMLGFMLGILNCIESVVTADPPNNKRRWPWQPKPTNPAPLLPFPQ